jgi:hypothetical protein
VRRRWLRFAVGFALALACVGSAGAFVQRALACAEMDQLRAACCANAKHTRFNGENGDCCRDLRWIEGARVATRAADPLPVQGFAVVPAREVTLAAVAPAVRVEIARGAHERPPPLRSILESTILLI